MEDYEKSAIIRELQDTCFSVGELGSQLLSNLLVTEDQASYIIGLDRSTPSTQKQLDTLKAKINSECPSLAPEIYQLVVNVLAKNIDE